MMPAAVENHFKTPAGLLAGIADAGSSSGLLLSGLTQDSRGVKTGYAFIAVQGGQQHGIAYLKQAVDQGAAIVFAEISALYSEASLRQLSEEGAIPVIAVKDLSLHLSEIASRFYNRPSEELHVIGVTGTNGKTSVAHYLAQVLDASGVIGTLGNGRLDDLHHATHTTPDAISLQSELRRLADDGLETIAMEVSSHALDQHRAAAVSFDTATFTNLSQDHLDYHGDMNAYADAKTRLFYYPSLKTGVINISDPLGCKLAEDVKGDIEVIGCSGPDTDPVASMKSIRIRSIGMGPSGIDVGFDSDWGSGEIQSQLLGDFNADNLMLVLGHLLSQGIDLEEAVSRLNLISAVPGRMQSLGGQGQPRVIVDFAHTPDALKQVLTSLRQHATGRLICVFGCGGERDQGKRPLMGRIAEQLADQVVLTDDNPRGEDSQLIIQEILAGLETPGAVLIQPQRAEAIRDAIQMADVTDLVLVAGKGHEDVQILGDLRIPFSDIEQVKKVLAEVSQ